MLKMEWRQNEEHVNIESSGGLSGGEQQQMGQVSVWSIYEAITFVQHYMGKFWATLRIQKGYEEQKKLRMVASNVCRKRGRKEGRDSRDSGGILANKEIKKWGTSQISDLTVCTALCQITDLTCSAAAFTVPALSRLCEATSLPAGHGSAAILDPGLEQGGREGPRGGHHQGDPPGEQSEKNDNKITGETTNLVINISDHLLSPAEFSVLQKGLSFCPTPNWDALQLKKDLESFYRTIRLKTHFGLNKDITGTPIPPTNNVMLPTLSITNLGLRNRSNFCPPRIYHATETFISLVDREVDSLIHQQRLGLFPSHSNLTSTEKQALSSLHTNTSIVVKPADKGGAIVVMNRAQYIGEIYRQLADTNTYNIISRDPVTAISQKIKTVIDTYLTRYTIDQKTASFLTNPHPVTPVFYVLPKIHKSLQNPPGRPIVASTDSVLSPLSVFLERILTPLVKTTRSFLLDTGHFLDVIKQLARIPSNSTLVTLDVCSLYTSIQHTKGIEATRHLLCQSSLSEDAIEFCLDLLTLVLYENYFLFEDTFYIQKCGTAMGSNVAPAYANAFMNHFETIHVFTDSLFLQNVACYHRYIDDIFLIWTGTTDTLLSFHSYLNSILPELQFTIHHNTHSVPFLDTMVLKDSNGNLSTDIYCKPTDCNSLLLYTSCHPRSLKDSLPRSQFNRVARIVSDPITLSDRLDDMTSKFKARHYPAKLLIEEKTRILSPPSPRPPRNTQDSYMYFTHWYQKFTPSSRGTGLFWPNPILPSLLSKNQSWYAIKDHPTSGISS
ncbi:unnamed protein product [Ranitomeya imitator]|uniref:Reverse transcriptase domain-containing protein n=1 Tax=Ranitomeya imitator TaxID=111125 RepID=A0ABN9LFE1_9NEOB|nr:unnamed protein product [Ranitomeya imitator]